jgi:hypothetical protein
MKIILSRKGFDFTSGGCPSPIMPDGTLLSLPIPEDNDRNVKYRDLRYGELTYDKILEGIKPDKSFKNCHLDPDIRQEARKKPVNKWKPAFGQRGAALAYLRNAGIKSGDLFLFFGVFRKVEYYDNSIRFVKGEKPVQIIYGYLQIGKIIETPEEIAEYHWHPHAAGSYDPDKNTLYLPNEKLSVWQSFPGYGILPYREDRVLTMPKENTATWKEHSFLMPRNIVGNRKNNAKSSGIYYQGQWQELVINDNEEAAKWAANLISGANYND